ncbi:hypothetical protein FRC04_006502 [Tulasnella sp. 424]|nr:hypothetical protein FRC04_006502 [Tulasnella sp. 424]KAG8981038.1 hypothetical protein FRC05_003938 [Tulasnella sp. 425]
MSSNIPQPKSRLVQPGSLSSSTSSSAGLRKPASSSALRSSTTSRPTSSKAGTGVPSTPTTSRITSSATTRPTLRNATSHSSLTASTNPVPRVKSPHRPTFRSTTSNGSTASTSSTRTTRPPPLKSPSKSPAKPLPSDLPELSPTPKAVLSLKEIIAQRRAEAKKASQQQRTRPNSALAGGGSGGDSSVIADGDLLPEDNDWNGGKGALSQQEEDDLLGRRSVKESIERARETGSLNLTSRTLSYLPTSLFSIHLTVDPELLPGQTASSAEDSTPHRQLAYYEAVDLTSLKARDNSLTVLQPELSLFGSLKVLDFAKNQLSTLPDSIGELACLVHLDLSENKFEQFPENAVSYLPALSWLDISRNQLKSLKFVGGMADGTGPTPPSPGFGSDSFFGPSSSLQRHGRGSGLSQPEVLPSLKTLNVADNQLSAASIDGIGGRGGAGAFPPKSLVKLDLSGNPLGAASPLVAVLSSAAPSLKELLMKKCELEQGSFAPLPETPDPSARKTAAAAGRSSRSGPFANLHVLDISENGWLTEQEVKEYFKAVVERAAVIGAPNESIDVVPGAVEVRLGMRDTREKWEVEAESKSRTGNNSNSNSNAAETDGTAGLAIGERERGAPPVMGGGRKRQDRPKSVQKEQWEADVDEGLHTEAGRLRKRLEEERKAAEAEEAKRKAKEQAAAAAAATTVDAASTSASKEEPSQAAKGTLDKHYDASSHTLALPSSKKKPAHNRHTSLTFSRSAAAASGGIGGAGDPNVPTETLPMTVIVTQPWSSSLRALHMSNRRADSVFTLPASVDHVRLERVEEVLLDGCALGDLVRVRRLSGDAGGEGTDDEPIFELLGGMFPAMTTLDLSENGLTKVPGLVKLFFPAGGEEGDGRKSGLKVLRLKGNAIVDVEGLVEVAERFGRGEGEGWRGEEIDIRDNQIPKLPPVLGLLHLDVLLVEGNV